MNAESYLTDQPISLYTQKVAEGSIPTSMGRGNANPFARNTQFTNEIKDTYVRVDVCQAIAIRMPIFADSHAYSPPDVIYRNKFSTDPADKAGTGATGNGGRLTLMVLNQLHARASYPPMRIHGCE